MKVTNASPELIGASEITITKDSVKIGQDPKALIFAVVTVGGILAGMFAAGPFLAWAGAGVVLAIGLATLAKDKRRSYTGEQISSVEVIGLDRVGTKGATGSLGGAAVGALAFGGVGAIVGSVAGGNKVQQFQNIGIKFEDGNWLVVANEGKGFVASSQFQRLMKLAGSKNACPF